MLTRNSLIRTAGAAALVAVLALAALADTIRLKDGSIIKGKITGFSGGRFTVAIGEGQRRREMVFSAGEVESIVFDSPAQAARTTVTPSVVREQPKSSARVVVSDNTTATRPQRPETVAASLPAQPASVKTSPPVKAPVINASTSKPVELSVKVLADNTSNGWTNSGWVVKKGQRIRITASGKIVIGAGRTVEAGGDYDLEDPSKLLKSVPTGALLAVIGDDNNDFLYIGTSREFVAERDGPLFLGVNEGNLDDNSGTFDVKVEIIP